MKYIKFIGYIGLYLIMQVLLQLILILNIDSNIQSRLLIVGSILCIFVFYLIFRGKYNKDIKDFKARYKEYLPLIVKYWFIGFIVMIFINAIVISIMGGISPNEETSRDIMNIYPLFYVLTASMLAPIIEESIFRLHVKNMVKEKYYVIVSGLLFGFMHVILSLSSVLDFLYVFPYIALGCVYASLYKKTDNICTPILAHFIHNTLTIIIVFLNV